MSKLLISQLKHEARMHELSGANSLSQLFNSAADKIAELEKELEQKTLQFVGYTNGNQIAHAKDGEGAFYAKTLNNCYIPLYMLNVHLHRLSGTMSGSWMSDLQAKQLIYGVK